MNKEEWKAHREHTEWLKAVAVGVFGLPADAPVLVDREELADEAKRKARPDDPAYWGVEKWEFLAGESDERIDLLTADLPPKTREAARKYWKCKNAKTRGEAL